MNSGRRGIGCGDGRADGAREASGAAIQKKILDYLGERQRLRQVPPTVREIAAACGISSTSGVTAAIRSLEEQGRLIKRAGTARGIMLRQPPGRAGRREFIDVPLLPFRDNPKLFWRSTPEGSVRLERRLLPRGELAAVAAPAGPGLLRLRSSACYLILSRTRPAPGETAALAVDGSLVVGPLYRSAPGWRLFDLFTGTEYLLSPNSPLEPLGRLAALFSLY